MNYENKRTKLFVFSSLFMHAAMTKQNVLERISSEFYATYEPFTWERFACKWIDIIINILSTNLHTSMWYCVENVVRFANHWKQHSKIQQIYDDFNLIAKRSHFCVCMCLIRWVSLWNQFLFLWTVSLFKSIVYEFVNQLKPPCNYRDECAFDVCAVILSNVCCFQSVFTMPDLAHLK